MKIVMMATLMEMAEMAEMAEVGMVETEAMLLSTSVMDPVLAR